MRVMEMPAHKPGYWWVNVAPLGEKPIWEEQVAPLPSDNLIFGYTFQQIDNKQRKR